MGALRLFAATTTNGTALSAQDRIELTHELARIAGIQIALACEDDDRARYLVIVQDGEVRIVALVDSRSADRLAPPDGAIRPRATARDVDSVIRRLQSGGAIDPISDLGDGLIEIPHLWAAKRDLLAALVDVQPQFTALPALIAGVAGRRYEVVPAEGFLECYPLYLFAPEAGPGFGEAFLDLACIPPPTGDEYERVLARPHGARSSSPAMRDPSRPFTTGTVEQRRGSINAAITAKTRDFGRLISALQDPANGDARYDQVRRDLYRYLGNHDTREIAGLFLWALQEESETIIETVTKLAWRQSRLLVALPDLFESAAARGDQRTAARMRAALDEAGA